MSALPTPNPVAQPGTGRPRKKKTYCPDCQEPRPDRVARICESCAPFHRQAFQQDQVRLIDGRTLSLGGKVRRHSGCP